MQSTRHSCQHICQPIFLCVLLVLLAWKPPTNLTLLDLPKAISQAMKFFAWPRLLVVLLQCSKIFTGFRELALLHTLTHVVVDKSTLRIPQAYKYLIVAPLRWSAALDFLGQEMLTGSMGDTGRQRCVSHLHKWCGVRRRKLAPPFNII